MAQQDSGGPRGAAADDPQVATHLATDRAGKIAGHAAYGITRGLVESGVPDDGVVVLRTDGPHRSIAGLQRLIDEALDEQDDTGPHDTGRPPTDTPPAGAAPSA